MDACQGKWYGMKISVLLAYTPREMFAMRAASQMLLDHALTDLAASSSAK